MDELSDELRINIINHLLEPYDLFSTNKSTICLINFYDDCTKKIFIKWLVKNNHLEIIKYIEENKIIAMDKKIILKLALQIWSHQTN